MPVLRLLVLTVFALAFALPAQAVPVAPVTERVYFHCGSNAKASAKSQPTYAWNTTAPTTSYTANGGCGHLDLSPEISDQPRFTGTHTGTIDSLTVHAWVIDAGLSRTGAFADVWLQAALTIDGVKVADAGDVKVVPTPSATGVSRLLEFSFTKIGLTGENDGGAHSVQLDVGSMPYEDGDTIAWVLDATELDSGVTFNPARPAVVNIRVR